MEVSVMRLLWRFGGSWRGWVLPVILLACWEYTSHRDAAHAYAFVPLEQIGVALRELLESGDLLLNLKGSLVRTCIGLAIGVVTGVSTGLLMAFSSVARTLINPLYQSLRQVPLLGLTPLIALWVGNGEPAKIFIIALAAYYPMVLSTYEGVRNVDGRYGEVGYAYGLTRAQVLKRVLVPAASPSFFSGLQQAVPFAWIAAVAGELLFNVGAGLGNLMMTAETNARMDIIIVCTATIALLGMAMSQIIASWSVYALRWRR
jgi:sulfonate transport system permease protein